ncbi:hypothetical protein [uncultured Jannaschia sp.]|uniref:hypothetical protein n=1 Tax=uncultured Jannaschia sp. TaxID=293347 RepID=UPI002605F99C|nr:hypothetical protein [uncultured Jannaschia sp.]
MIRLVVLCCVLACAPVWCRAQQAVAARSDIIEVSVIGVDGGIETIGQGWAFGDWTLDGRPCRIVTPYHVIQSQFGQEPANEIYVRGPGQGAEAAAFLLPALSYPAPDIDLAVLRLGRNLGCPFDPADAVTERMPGLWLTRLAPRTRAADVPVELDAAAGMVPAEGAGRFIGLSTADGTEVRDGWSGSSVVANGHRVAMVVESRPGGANALPVVEMQRLWGNGLNITDAPEVDDPAAARTALTQLGYSFTPRGLVDAIAARDANALTLYRHAGMAPETVLEALALQMPGAEETALMSLFRAAREDPLLLEWFAAELTRGLDPNGLVPSAHYDGEALLISAFRTENAAAVKLLLAAGASPNTYQELDRTIYWSPRVMRPLNSVVRMETVPLEERREIARLMIEAGAVLPDAVMRKWDGTYAPFGPGDRGKQVAGETGEDLAALGIAATPTPDLCDAPRPPVCETASRIYGRDWCAMVAALPKGFAGEGEGAYHIEPLTITHLLSIDREQAHFRAMSGVENGWSEYLVSVGADLGSVSVTVLDETYDCKPRLSDGHVPNTCWEERVLAPHPDGAGWKWGSWGASFRFYDLCAGSPDPVVFYEDQANRLAWQEDLRATTAELNLFTAALLRIRDGADPEGARATLARSLQAEERHMAGNLDYTASQRSDVFGADTLPDLLGTAERRAALVELYLGRPGTPFHDVLAENILTHLPLGPSDMVLSQATGVVSDLAEIGLARLPETLRIVSRLPDLSFSDGAFRMAQSWADKRLIIVGRPAEGRAGVRIDTYGSHFWQVVPDGKGKIVRTDLRQALFWQPDNAGEVIDLLNVADVPEPTSLPVDAALARQVMEANGISNRAKDWVFVSDLRDPHVRAVEGGQFVLKATLGTVRLVAADGTLVATYAPEDLIGR